MYKIVGFLFLGLLFVRCVPDDEIEAVKIYNFETEIEVNYNSDTIGLGDTIWFYSEVYGSLKDSASQKNIFITEAIININLFIRSWSIENQDYQPDNFNVVYKNRAQIGYIGHTPKAGMLGLYYSSNKGLYELSFGVVFKKTGIYSIDADYLSFSNYYSNNFTELGGGYMQLYDINDTYAEANIKSVFTGNRNIHIYEGLSDNEKQAFRVVNDQNESKYFFIKVND